MKKMYIVKYDMGDYDSYSQIEVFVTDNKSKATKYVTKFNRIFKAYREFYKKLENADGGMRGWIRDEHVHKYFDRWHFLGEVGQAYWEEIEVR